MSIYLYGTVCVVDMNRKSEQICAVCIYVVFGQLRLGPVWLCFTKSGFRHRAGDDFAVFVIDDISHTDDSVSSNSVRNSSAWRFSNMSDGRNRIACVPHPPSSRPRSIASRFLIINFDSDFKILLWTTKSRCAIDWWSHATRVPRPRTLVTFGFVSAIFLINLALTQFNFKPKASSYR